MLQVTETTKVQTPVNPKIQPQLDFEKIVNRTNNQHSGKVSQIDETKIEPDRIINITNRQNQQE